MRFPDILKSLRKSQGLSQTELANRLGFTQQAVARWEIGKNPPDLDTLVQLADLFDVSTDYLVGRGNVRKLFWKGDHGWGWNAVLSKEDAALLGEFRQLNEKGQAKVITYTLDMASIARYTEPPKTEHTDETKKKN